MSLKKEFYARKPDEVARDLLGKLMINDSDKRTSGYIVETEAYYGEDDPASRAAQNGKTNMTGVMWSEPGTVFVYMVHGHWMLNVVTGEEGEPSAVLFRALKPYQGIDLMKKRRNKEKTTELCSGPGKLTQSMEVDKSFNEKSITTEKGLRIHEKSLDEFEIKESKRIGVTSDLQVPLRFFLKDSEFISR